MIAPARTAAFRALREVTAQGAQPAAVLAREKQLLTDERDRALATEITIGTLRWQRALDALIEQAAGRPLPSIDRDVLVILRLSLYQLRHLDRVPAAAVVDDAVAAPPGSSTPCCARFRDSGRRCSCRHALRAIRQAA
jgi:16S rRNA (cytosine967-C5)-methyltransferase